MGEFEGIIGYEKIKQELAEILSVLQEPKRFKALGAIPPRGLLLYGEPGVGKTLLAQAFVKASQRRAYLASPRGDEEEFLRDLSALFSEAKKNPPSIIFLDDMDKYGASREDEKPYHLLQSLIDSLDGEDVYVIATANSLVPLPQSLIRDGRFDARLEIMIPNAKDGAALVHHFLQERPCEGINEDDVQAMASFRSCAAIKSAINQAAIKAAYAHHSSITMSDIVSAFLSAEVGEGPTFQNEGIKQEAAIHEAGHLLLNEATEDASVGFVSLYGTDQMEGYCRIRKVPSRRPYAILSALGGKAAVEVLLGRLASGSERDLSEAKTLILDGLGGAATGGMSFLTYRDGNLRSGPQIRDETASAATFEMERYLMKAKEMVVANRAFVEQASAALVKQGYLLSSDIAALKKEKPLNNEPLQRLS